MDTIRIAARVRYVTLIVGLSASGLLAIAFCWFLLGPTDADRAKKTIEVFGIGIGVTALTYTAMTVRQICDQAAEAIARDRRKVAAEMVSQWHSPEMVALTLKGHKLRHAAKSNANVDVIELIKNDQDAEKAIVCIFNYFEKLAISIDHDLVDEDYLRTFFGNIVKGYFHDLFQFAEKKRRQLQTTKVFDRFEAMAKRWEGDDLSPSVSGDAMRSTSAGVPVRF